MKDRITAAVLAALMLTLSTCQVQPDRAPALPATQTGVLTPYDGFGGASAETSFAAFLRY